MINFELSSILHFIMVRAGPGDQRSRGQAAFMVDICRLDGTSASSYVHSQNLRSWYELDT